MQRIPLEALERTVLGKKVKVMRRIGLVPARVYGHTKSAEAVTINVKDFMKVYSQTGETGLIDLIIGSEKARPVMVKGIQQDPVRGDLVHIDFYQVDLAEKVQVAIPVELIGEQPESVHLGETVVLQPISEVQVEALPGDLLEKIEVDQSILKVVDDVVTVADLKIDREKITILTPEEEVVIKLAPAITEEMKKLMEEQESEAATAQAEAATEEGATAEGETSTEEGAEATDGEAKAEDVSESSEKSAE